MGRPKALLPFGDQPLILRIVTRLQHRFTQIVVVAAPGQELPPMPVTVVRDEVADQGPVGGIYYGLSASHTDVAFVTSCDAAFLNLDLIAYLVSQIQEYDAVAPYWDGRLQPLHAVYRRSIAPQLAAQLARGDLRLTKLFELDGVRTRRIDADEIRRFDPDGDTFFNINTPEDYAEALRRLTGRSFG